MNRLVGILGVAVPLTVVPDARANITFDSGVFNSNGWTADNTNVFDGGPIPGFGTHSRYATDGSTLTMDATSELGVGGFHDAGWTMTYTDTSGHSTATGMGVTFTVLTPLTYAFSGAVHTNSTTPVYTYSDVYLQNLTTSQMVFYDNAQWSNTAVVSHTSAPDTGSFAGALTPGHQYVFYMYLQSGVSEPGTDATFGVNFDLVFVPAPGAVALLGLGGAVAMRRRR